MGLYLTDFLEKSMIREAIEERDRAAPWSCPSRRGAAWRPKTDRRNEFGE